MEPTTQHFLPALVTEEALAQTSPATIRHMVGQHRACAYAMERYLANIEREAEEVGEWAIVSLSQASLSDPARPFSRLRDCFVTFRSGRIDLKRWIRAQGAEITKAWDPTCLALAHKDGDAWVVVSDP